MSHVKDRIQHLVAFSIVLTSAGCSRGEQEVRAAQKPEAPIAPERRAPAQEQEAPIDVRISTGESRRVVRGDLLKPATSDEFLRAAEACMREGRIDRSRFRLTSIHGGAPGVGLNVDLNVVPVHDGVPVADSPMLVNCGTGDRLPRSPRAGGEPAPDVPTTPAISLGQAAAVALEEMRGRFDWHQKKDEDVIADLLLTHVPPGSHSGSHTLVWAFGTAGTALPEAVLVDAVNGGLVHAGSAFVEPNVQPWLDTVGGLEAKSIRQTRSHDTRTVFFSSARVGYAAGYDGAIIKTADGGQTWKPQESGTLKPLRSLYFVDEMTGYAAGGASSPASGRQETVLLKTTNGGATWIRQHTPTNTEASAIAFSDKESGVAVGLGFILWTKNGGREWTRAEGSPRGFLNTVRLLSPQSGIATGLFGTILRSEDGGRTWSHVSSPIQAHIYALSFVNNSVGYGAGQGRMIKTTDGGRSWKELTESPSEIYGLHFIDEQTGVAVGRGRGEKGCFGGGQPKTHVIHVTRDGGRTWASNTRPWGVDFLHAVHFPDARTGYAVGWPQIVQLTLDR